MVNGQQLMGLLYDRAKENANRYWMNKLKYTPLSKVHIAIMAGPYLSLILDGKKTVESRFSKKRVSPWKRIEAGDVVILKRSGGDFVAAFEAESVIFEEINNDIERLKSVYNDKLCAADSFWQDRSDSKYATLICIANLFPFEGFRFVFKNRQAWIDLGCRQGSTEKHDAADPGRR